MSFIRSTAVRAWSYSRLACFEECPARFKYKFIEKMREPDSVAASRGDAIHKKAEAFLKNPKQRIVPEELTGLTDTLRTARKLGAIAEEQWAFDGGWQPMDDWFGKDVWLRVKTDARYMDGKTLHVYDWKTGKVKIEKHKDQLSLYALTGMLWVPEAEKVETWIGYSDHNTVVGGKDMDACYTRKDIPKLKKQWGKRVIPMFADKVHAPRPGPTCRWCHFRKDNGGPCKFSSTGKP